MSDIARMDHAYFADFVDAAPAYTEIEVDWSRGTLRLMARDLPRPGRRWTNLTSGTEVFDLAAALSSWEAHAARITKFPAIELS